jgi:ABC-2 type transport system permease protein
MAQLSVDVLQLEDSAEQTAAFEAAFGQAMEAWQSPPLGTQSEMAIIPHPEYGTSGFNAYSQASPGMIVQFAVYGLIQSAMVLVLERKTGALQRLLTTPISRFGVITGHVVAMFVVAAVQILLLVAVGVLAFGVPYMHDPAATLLMVVSMAIWSASLGLLIGAISKEEGQVIMYSLLAMMVLSAMGGAWFPLDVSGEAFSTIGHFLPTAWAMDGMQNIIVRGQGLASVLQPAGILLGYTAAFFALAVWRFKFE